MTAVHNAAVREMVEQWIEECIIGLSLCPYARVPYEQGKVRIVVCDSTLPNVVLQFLQDEARDLQQSGAETSLVVCAQVGVGVGAEVGAGGFADFLDFNDFLDDAEERLQQTGYDVHFQLVSFHPGYLFAGEAPDDASQYTNRGPFPILQLLRVDSVTEAVDSGDTLSIPQRNIKTLRAIGRAELEQLFPWCRKQN